jgi:hypothetical protein
MELMYNSGVGIYNLEVHRDLDYTLEVCGVFWYNVIPEYSLEYIGVQGVCTKTLRYIDNSRLIPDNRFYSQMDNR